jgi:hypothetical protein
MARSAPFVAKLAVSLHHRVELSVPNVTLTAKIRVQCG